MTWLSSRKRELSLLGFSILLIVVTRVPFLPSYLYSFDSVNLALALQEFDPLQHQPQPPGYPLFVAEARVLYLLLGTPERTFAFLAVIVSALAVLFSYLLGTRMFSERVGLFAAALLFVNPAFWFAGLTSPLRLHLALVSLLLAYFCWRSWEGEPRYLLAASLTLGLGAGTRPELLVTLLPLWAWTAWRARRSGHLVRSILLLAASVLLWVAMLTVGYGGLARMVSSLEGYFYTEAVQTSPLLEAPLAGWRRMAGRAVIWTSLGALCWIWALPFGWRALRRAEPRKPFITFLTLWILPPFLFSLFVHIGDPDQALTAIAGLGVAGAVCLVGAERALMHRWAVWLPEGVLASWIIFANLPLFFGEFLPPRREATTQFRGLASATDAWRIAAYESSFSRVRWVDQMAANGFRVLEELQAGTERPVVALYLRDGEPSWRKVCYYFPSLSVYILEEGGERAVLSSLGRLAVNNKAVATYPGPPPIRIPIPRGARLVWLLGAAEVDKLAGVVSLQSAPPLYYTDLPPDAGEFRYGSFVFSPE